MSTSRRTVLSGLCLVAALAVGPTLGAWAEESDTDRAVRQLDRTRAERAAELERLDSYRERARAREQQRIEARRQTADELRARGRTFQSDRTTPRYYQPIEPLGTIRP